jgi:hypothetical protein
MEHTCCPEFDPTGWDEKIFEWKKKKFVKASVWSIFYIPLNLRKVRSRINKKLIRAGATNPENLSLTEMRTIWKTDLYLAVDKEVPGLKNVEMTGKFLSKSYDADSAEIEKSTGNFMDVSKFKQHTVIKLYTWNTTCPRCAQKYGKDYVVFIAQIK